MRRTGVPSRPAIPTSAPRPTCPDRRSVVDLRAGLRRVDTPLARSLLLGVAVSIAVTVVSRFGGLAGWETRAIDAFLFFRDRIPTPEIVLVNIDDAAFQEMGERQP